MTEFADEGFLCTGKNRWRKECRNRYLDWFALCKEFNRYCVGLTSKCLIQNNNRQQSLAAALFFKLLGIYEGSIILAENCMASEVKILLRGLLEALFKLRAITIKEEVAEEYYNNHFLEKLSILRRIKNSGSKKFYQSLNLDERIKELEKIVKQKSIVKLSIEGWAAKANLSDFYITAYPVFSWTVHSNVIDIGQYIVGKSDDEIEEVSWYPQIEEMDKLLLTAIECLVIASNSINQLFKLGITKEIEEYSEKYKQLARSLRDTKDELP